MADLYLKYKVIITLINCILDLFTSEHPAALGAHEAADGHVEVGGAPLLAVKALLVSRMLGLDLPHRQTELVILLHLPHVGNFGHFQFYCSRPRY